MNEVLGLIDSLEASILDGKKMPFTDNIMINEKQLLQLVDKIRLVVKSQEEHFVRRAVDVEERPNQQQEPSVWDMSHIQPGANSTLVTQTLKEAHEEANRIKSGADEYADYMLANLQLMIAKLQKNLVKLDRNLEDGRNILDTHKQTMQYASETEQEAVQENV